MFLARLSSIPEATILTYSPLYQELLHAPTQSSAYFGLVMSESQVQTQFATGPSSEKVVLRYEQVPETTYERMYIRYCLTRNDSKA